VNANGDQTVNDSDQTATWPPGIGDDLPQRLSAYDVPTDIDEPVSAAVITARLVSLGYLRAALRRRARLWCVLALVGLVVGCGCYMVIPHGYKATVSVLLADNPGVDPDTEVQTDMALAQSAPVAAGVIRQLGLQQTPNSFLGTYTVTKVTDQVVQITVSAPTSNGAVQRASAVAEQFLKFRDQYGETQQQETNAQLDQEVSQAQQHLASITKQISRVSAQAISRSRRAALNDLRAQETTASSALPAVQQYAIQTKASTETVTQQVVQGSEVLSAASLVKSSRLGEIALYAGGGLLGGLVLGLAIVIIGAITSDRLRRRDDIAYAFGAPVRLSVGSLRESRLVPARRGEATARRGRMERIVEHLHNAVRGNSSRPVGLAVVAVDDARTVARAVVDLAVSSAKDRRQVVLADLSQGAHAARLLGIDRPGIGTASADGMHIVVVVPEANDVAPAGPLRSHPSSAEDMPADEALASVYARADLVLSLVTLDPASGGEHLATWATDVVAVVTAGQSSVVRVHAVGEMIRLAGARLGSVVVIGADKSDESLGVIDTAYSPAPL
jgi:capsular polysaccharide biosynthesis protein